MLRRNVSVAFEDLFGCNVGVAGEEGRVVEDGLKILGHLRK